MENSSNFNRNKRRAFFFGLMVLIPLVKSLIVMLLWNAILPDLFKFPAINYWQALGLFILCKILFGNFGFGRFNYKNKPFRNPAFREKFMNLSAEEKEKLKQQWKERCQK